jgi:hypothetical protein
LMNLREGLKEGNLSLEGRLKKEFLARLSVIGL